MNPGAYETVSKLMDHIENLAVELVAPARRLKEGVLPF